MKRAKALATKPLPRKAVQPKGLLEVDGLVFEVRDVRLYDDKIVCVSTRAYPSEARLDGMADCRITGEDGSLIAEIRTFIPGWGDRAAVGNPLNLIIEFPFHLFEVTGTRRKA